MRPEIIAALAVPLFLAFFTGLWCMVVLLISYVSGWRTLAKHFRAEDKPSGRFLAMQSLSMNSAQYNGALTLGITETGLYLEPIVLFRLGHAPLLIPWTAFRSLRAEKMLWMTGAVTEVVTNDGDTVTVTFYDNQLAQVLATHLSQQLPRIGT